MRSSGILQKFSFILFSLVLLTACSARNREATPSAAVPEGADFVSQARWIHDYLVAASPSGPAGMDPARYDAHRNYIRERMERYRKEFIEPFMAFMAGKRPAVTPGTVVYPFGGSDFATAIATFPDATEITTISLEGAGDPRQLPVAPEWSRSAAFAEFRAVLGSFLSMYDNTNENVRASEKGLVPGQLSLSIAEAGLFGYAPVSLRFFRIEPDGSLHYYDAADIDKLKDTRGERLHLAWEVPGYSTVFRNMEIVYRRDDRGTIKTLVHRHVAANLHDSRYTGSPLSAYLEKRGTIAGICKAGAYLLWRKDFSGIRNFMLNHMTFMVSDSTGILPRHAREAGFEQVTYGEFHGAFLDDEGGADAAGLRELFRSQEKRELPVRYGYSDVRKANHLIITRKKAIP